jgi:membrane protein DedA with SNARE-associated domain
MSLTSLAELPPWLIYVLMAAGAAVENVVPPVPADSFVVLGAILAAAGRAHPLHVFLATWLANVGGAFVVYALARRYGNRFFNTAAGHWLLHPRQIEQVGRFYRRWGWPAMFVSRFLPGIRAVVPVFAGVAQIPAHLVVPPLALASAIWYGLLVYLGAMAGHNLESILALLQRVSAPLVVLAVAVGGAGAVWWWKTRHE